jgi:peroxiredoxin
LQGMVFPPTALRATDGSDVDISTLRGTVVLYLYPMTGKPGADLPPGWDEIPGARGCTPQSCAFRDLMADLRAAGADHVFGISTQSPAYQVEARERLHLPFQLLSDEQLQLQRALSLPVFEAEVEGENTVLLKRMAMVLRGGRIEKIFYPVFPPDRNAADVLEWLRQNPA